VLVIGSPEAEPAQPRALIGGHMPGLTGPHAWAAGINPLLVASNNLPWSFLFVPVLAARCC